MAIWNWELRAANCELGTGNWVAALRGSGPGHLAGLMYERARYFEWAFYGHIYWIYNVIYSRHDSFLDLQHRDTAPTPIPVQVQVQVQFQFRLHCQSVSNKKLCLNKILNYKFNKILLNLNWLFMKSSARSACHKNSLKQQNTHTQLDRTLTLQSDRNSPLSPPCWTTCARINCTLL